MSGIDPAGLDALVEAVGRLGIDAVLVQYQAAEGRLDVSAGTTKPIVEIEVTEGGIDVVAPEQADSTPTEPDAFGIAGGPGNRTLNIRVLIDLLGRFFGRGGFAVGRGIVGRLRQCRKAQWNRYRSKENRGA